MTHGDYNSYYDNLSAVQSTDVDICRWTGIRKEKYDISMNIEERQPLNSQPSNSLFVWACLQQERSIKSDIF